MEFLLILVLAFIFGGIFKSTSRQNTKSKKGLSDYEKFDIYNKFNKK